MPRHSSDLPILLAIEELALADARNRLSELVAEVEKTHARVTITKHGHPAAVLVSPEDLASLEEAVDILSDPEALDPHRVGKPLGRELAGYFSARRGAYRVTYRLIEDDSVVHAVRIEHRADVYRRR
ncbi:MAG: type II toxin-antitoxin system prevent-host-death family antitoxin [Nocardioidaceae bacterium]